MESLEQELERMYNNGQAEGIAGEMAREVIKKGITAKYKLGKRKQTPTINFDAREVVVKNYEAMGRIKHKTKIEEGWQEAKYGLTMAGMYIGIGMLKLLEMTFAFIEKQSINYLSKTRPDISYMMKRKEPFNKIAQQYFYKGSP